MHAARAGEVIRRGVVWDNHACMPLRPDDLGVQIGLQTSLAFLRSVVR